MKIFSTSEFKNEASSIFDLAEKERVIVKRGRKYVNLLVSTNPETNFVDDEWIKEFRWSTDAIHLIAVLLGIYTLQINGTWMILTRLWSSVLLQEN